MLLAKLAVLALVVSPLAANASSTRLVCSAQGAPVEIQLVTGDPGFVKVFTPVINFVVEASKVAPLFKNQADLMNNVTVLAKDVQGVSLVFVKIGESDYGRPLLQTSLKLMKDGKATGGVLGNCTVAPRYGY